MKKIQPKQSYKCVYTRSQKIKGWLAFIMLFVCGVMVGVGFNEHKQIKANVEQWDPTKCFHLQNLMTHSETSAEKLVELNKMYSEYCANVKKKVKPEVKKEYTSSKETCELIEEIQLRWLNDESSPDIEAHQEEGQEVFIAIGVHPDHCDKGYGQQMLADTCRIAGELYPGKPLCLEVRTWNARAIRCYQKAGFVIDGEAYELMTLSGSSMFYRMVKDRT